jgi:hypothetical protein
MILHIVLSAWPKNSLLSFSVFGGIAQTKYSVSVEVYYSDGYSAETGNWSTTRQDRVRQLPSGMGSGSGSRWAQGICTAIMHSVAYATNSRVRRKEPWVIY